MALTYEYRLELLELPLYWYENLIRFSAWLIPILLLSQGTYRMLQKRKLPFRCAAAAAIGIFLLGYLVTMIFAGSIQSLPSQASDFAAWGNGSASRRRNCSFCLKKK